MDCLKRPDSGDGKEPLILRERISMINGTIPLKMRSQIQIESIVAALNEALGNAWGTFSLYAAALMSQPSDPDVHKEKLADEIRAIYVGVAFAIEALDLPGLLAEFKDGLEAFRKDPTAISIDQLGDP